MTCATCGKPEDHSVHHPKGYKKPTHPFVAPASAGCDECEALGKIWKGGEGLQPEPPKCRDCGAAINEGEAKVFGVCDACWDKAYPKQPEPATQGEAGVPTLDAPCMFEGCTKTNDHVHFMRDLKPVVAEVKRLRAENAALREALETATGLLEKQVDGHFPSPSCGCEICNFLDANNGDHE